MLPDPDARPEYIAAFREIAARIAAALASVPKRALPIRMYVAGGAALHFYTGARASRDIDATFSRRFALPEDLEVSYRSADGAGQALYFDRQYNDTLGLLHEDAYDDSVRLTLDGIDPRVLDVRLLTPVDLAVTKLGRFTEQDRADIIALAKHGLLDSNAVRKRAEAALGGFVGDTTRVQGSIEIACRLIDDAQRRGGKKRD